MEDAFTYQELSYLADVSSVAFRTVDSHTQIHSVRAQCSWAGLPRRGLTWIDWAHKNALVMLLTGLD